MSAIDIEVDIDRDRLLLPSRGLTRLPSLDSPPFTNLTQVIISGNKLTSIAPLASLPQLATLLADDAGLSDTSLQDWPTLPALSILSACKNAFSSACEADLRQTLARSHSSLSFLALLGCPVAAPALGNVDSVRAAWRLRWLRAIPSLKALDSTPVTTAERRAADTPEPTSLASSSAKLALAASTVPQPVAASARPALDALSGFTEQTHVALSATLGLGSGAERVPIVAGDSIRVLAAGASITVVQLDRGSCSWTGVLAVDSVVLVNSDAILERALRTALANAPRVPSVPKGKPNPVPTRSVPVIVEPATPKQQATPAEPTATPSSGGSGIIRRALGRVSPSPSPAPSSRQLPAPSAPSSPTVSRRHDEPGDNLLPDSVSSPATRKFKLRRALKRTAAKELGPPRAPTQGTAAETETASARSDICEAFDAADSTALRETMRTLTLKSRADPLEEMMVPDDEPGSSSASGSRMQLLTKRNTGTDDAALELALRALATLVDPTEEEAKEIAKLNAMLLAGFPEANATAVRDKVMRNSDTGRKWESALALDALTSLYTVLGSLGGPTPPGSEPPPPPKEEIVEKDGTRMRRRRKKRREPKVYERLSKTSLTVFEAAVRVADLSPEDAAVARIRGVLHLLNSSTAASSLLEDALRACGNVTVASTPLLKEVESVAAQVEAMLGSISTLFRGNRPKGAVAALLAGLTELHTIQVQLLPPVDVPSVQVVTRRALRKGAVLDYEASLLHADTLLSNTDPAQLLSSPIANRLILLVDLLDERLLDCLDYAAVFAAAGTSIEVEYGREWLRLLGTDVRGYVESPDAARGGLDVVEVARKLGQYAKSLGDQVRRAADRAPAAEPPIPGSDEANDDRVALTRAMLYTLVHPLVSEWIVKLTPRLEQIVTRSLKLEETVNDEAACLDSLSTIMASCDQAVQEVDKIASSLGPADPDLDALTEVLAKRVLGPLIVGYARKLVDESLRATSASDVDAFVAAGYWWRGVGLQLNMFTRKSVVAPAMSTTNDWIRLNTIKSARLALLDMEPTVSKREDAEPFKEALSALADMSTLLINGAGLTVAQACQPAFLAVGGVVTKSRRRQTAALADVGPLEKLSMQEVVDAAVAGLDAVVEPASGVAESLTFRKLLQTCFTVCIGPLVASLMPALAPGDPFRAIAFKRTGKRGGMTPVDAGTLGPTDQTQASTRKDRVSVALDLLREYMEADGEGVKPSWISKQKKYLMARRLVVLHGAESRDELLTLHGTHAVDTKDYGAASLIYRIVWMRKDKEAAKELVTMMGVIAE